MTQPAWIPAQQYPPVAAPTPHPGATTALVLGLLSFLTFGFLGPFAWAKSAKVLKEVRLSGGALTGGPATAGMVLGVLSTFLVLLPTLLVVGIFLVGGFLSASFAPTP